MTDVDSIVRRADHIEHDLYGQQIILAQILRLGEHGDQAAALDLHKALSDARQLILRAMERHRYR